MFSMIQAIILEAFNANFPNRFASAGVPGDDAGKIESIAFHQISASLLQLKSLF